MYDLSQRLEKVTELCTTKALTVRRPSIPTILDWNKSTLEMELNEIGLGDGSNINEVKLFSLMDRIISRIEVSHLFFI